jgi:hypothetical protein
LLVRAFEGVGLMGVCVQSFRLPSRQPPINKLSKTDSLGGKCRNYTCCYPIFFAVGEGDYFLNTVCNQHIKIIYTIASGTF